MLDLYAGAGNFSVPLAEGFKEVTAVESDSRLCRFLELNLKKNYPRKRFKLEAGSVESYFKKKPSRHQELIVADPPRNGLGKLVNEFNFGKRLILVSCDLAAFSRDLRALLDLGWRLNSIQPFDMFAQTGHLELVGVLDRDT